MMMMAIILQLSSVPRSRSVRPHAALRPRLPPPTPTARACVHPILLLTSFVSRRPLRPYVACSRVSGQWQATRRKLVDRDCEISQPIERILFPTNAGSGASLPCWQYMMSLSLGTGLVMVFGVAHVAAAGLFSHPLAQRPELGRVLRRVVVEQV